jgi:hypothetical protein
MHPDPEPQLRSQVQSTVAGLPCDAWAIPRSRRIRVAAYSGGGSKGLAGSMICVGRANTISDRLPERPPLSRILDQTAVYPLRVFLK